MQVFKFGGTSIGSAEALGRAVAIASGTTGPLVVVVSAMAGMTDLLLEALAAVREGVEPRGVPILRARHHAAIDALLTGQEQLDARAEVDAACDELGRVLAGAMQLGEVSTHTSDRVQAYGERSLAKLFVRVLRGRGREVTYVDALEVIEVAERFGALHAEAMVCRSQAARAIRPWLDRGHVVVVPGYLGRKDGRLVTLGRGGSDFSAAILASALDADAVTLFKEVDGLMTTDPRIVPEARLVEALHYREAAELAYYGAKILHPRTMIPLVEKGIPLTLRNTFRPEAPGTRIAGDVKPGRAPVKALAAFRAQALIAVEGKGMMGVPGVASRTFGALAAEGISVSLITQASSESSISFVVPRERAEPARRALEHHFRAEIDAGILDSVRTDDRMAVLAVVGLGMRRTKGVAARTFSALGRIGANVAAIAQGSSELNISVVIADGDVDASLQALHQEFQLDKSHALGERDENDLAIAQLGLGQIGQALVGQLVGQTSFARESLEIALRYVALTDRSGLVLNEAGFDPEALGDLVATKKAGRPLVESVRPMDACATLEAIERKVLSLPFGRCVVVDTTAEDTWSILYEAVRRGAHVVTANKKPLAVEQGRFDALFACARSHGVSVRYEATVGAGLPVLDTLAKLRDSGDRVTTLLGCLSGTLGFLCSRLEDGVAFSQALREARDAGYTEPDPRDDLSGIDVARKALILARTLGLKLDLTDIAVTPVVPLGSGSAADFMATAAQHDESVREQVARAAREGAVLRYVARVGDTGVRVGLENVPKASSLGGLRGAENQVVLHTLRYASNPLVVTGPGAGAEVTAAGVVNDILAIGGQRRRA